MTAPIPFESAWHILSIFLVFLVGIVLSRYVGLRVGDRGWRPLFLYCYHTIWCFVFFWYSNINGADTFAYYYSGSAGQGEFRLGTDFVVLIVEFLSVYCGLSYLGIFLVFNIFGSIGFIFFDACLRFVNADSQPWMRSLALIIILLPSVSFWSSAISKDAISFMAIGIALWASIDLRTRLKLLAFSFLLLFLVRPHMAGLMVMSLALSMFFDRSTSMLKRFFLFIIFIGGASVLVPFALDYAGVKGGANIDAITDFIDKRQSYTRGETSIDLTSMSFPEKLFTYAFRPFFVEARNLFELAASIDNILLLFLFCSGVYLSFKVRLGSAYGNSVFMLCYSLSSWTVLSLTTANLGIALRQKWMFVPFLIYLAFAYLNRNKTLRLSRT